ncbi:hypothetical protein GJ25_gp083 [Mycobacterium phage Hawkeye]|uniref:Uncharacterized protein n=1 Tax=Mycobacterium phage Hawkeye TaxID=1458711 RepID=X2KYY1_9CAUD|nr:hypothetical protein GJ25_gp083 [Mycobacterium phage Hawkeye]AHN84094.1 hypothetical protein PBI_HAWKEYE_83 [Mycobacterium phage Hawkeye]
MTTTEASAASVGDQPPRWLKTVLAHHQPSVRGWCSCSWRKLDSVGNPTKYVVFNAAHQAAEVHKALSEGIFRLMNRQAS